MKAILFSNDLDDDDFRYAMLGRFGSAIMSCGDQFSMRRVVDTDQFAEVAITWGIRSTPCAVQSCIRHIVMENGFIGDRQGGTVYLGYSALNGCGKPIISPAYKNDRGSEFHHLLRPPKVSCKRVVVMGQVCGDTNLEAFGSDASVSRREYVLRWLGKQVRYWQSSGFEVAVKHHPKDPISRGYLSQLGVPMIDTLDEAFEWGDVAVAFNSNSLTDAFIAGLYVIPSNIGSLTWDVRSSPNNFRRFTDSQRREWLDYVCCYQWRPEQFKEAWEAIKNNG